MADNVAITAGSGTSVATDDVSGVHYQKVKLIDGTADSSAAIKGDATYGLDVDVTRLPSLPAGDNNIGNVDIVTMPNVVLGAGSATIGKLAANSGVDIGDVDVKSLPSLPAGTNNIGDVDVVSLPAHGASAETSSIYNGATALTPKFAAISASSSGNNTAVAAVDGKKIRVLALQLTANGSVNAKWQSGAGGTDLTGLAYLVANGGLVLPFNPVGWFETASGALLNLNLSGAVAVGGSLVYVEV